MGKKSKLKELIEEVEAVISRLEAEIVYKKSMLKAMKEKEAGE